MAEVTTRDGTRLYVKDWGKGRPVVLLHGWPLQADSWDDTALALASSGYRAIAYDRRGFGRSDQPWDGYDYDTLADDLAAVVEYAGGSDAAIVGFSMGGGEVARYMSRHGGKNVTRAALVASVVPYMLKTGDNPNGVDPGIFEKMTAGMKQDRAAFWGAFFKDFFGIGIVTKPVSPETLDWARAMAMQAGLRPTLACAQAFATTDFRPDLASFKVPTLVIHGTGDKTVPIDASARPAAKGIPGAKLIEYEGAPHGLFATHKMEVTRDLLAFLR
jgi:pimeloyl-ACP methyl ester carboxylesterase